MAPLRRLPYPKKSPMTFPIVILGALALVLLVIMLASAPASAGPAPEGGPRLGGGALPDGTLVGLFTFDTANDARWLSELDTLETGSLWAFVYNPNTRTESGQLDLKFTWETPTMVMHQVNVDGEIQTRTETVWNVTDTRTFQVSAPYRSVDFTELDIPRKDGERLTISAGEREVQLEQLLHKTNPVFVKLPRQVAQDAYLNVVKVLGLAFAASALGIASSRWAYNKGGRYVPPLGGKFWALGILLFGAVALWLWNENREGIVLKGSLPPLAALSVLVCFFTLQVWRDEPDTDIFVRIHDTMESNTPKFSAWRRYIPTGEDPRPLSEETFHQRYVDDSWRSFFWRFFLNARTYLEYPETNRWHYERNGGPFRRLHILEGGKGFETTERPSFTWFTHGWRLPWWTIHRLGITKVPVSPWAQKEKVLDVLAQLKEQQAMADDHQELMVEAATLRAQLRAGIDKRAKELVDVLMLAFRATAIGESFQAAKRKHQELKATHEAKDKPLPQNGGEGGAPVAVQVPVGPQPPGAAAGAVKP